MRAVIQNSPHEYAPQLAHSQRPDLPRLVRSGICGGVMPAQCLGMMTVTDLPSIPSDYPVPYADQLRLAVAAT
jgi:hypothetical protein